MNNFKLSLYIKENDSVIEFSKTLDYENDLDLAELSAAIYEIIRATDYSETSILKELLEWHANFKPLPENITWDPNYKTTK